MKQTVLANPGAIGLSIAGETDKYRMVANVVMMGEKLLGRQADEGAIRGSLSGAGIDATSESIEKVKSFFAPGREW